MFLKSKPNWWRIVACVALAIFAILANAHCRFETFWVTYDELPQHGWPCAFVGRCFSNQAPRYTIWLPSPWIFANDASFFEISWTALGLDACFFFLCFVAILKKPKILLPFGLTRFSFQLSDLLWLVFVASCVFAWCSTRNIKTQMLPVFILCIGMTYRLIRQNHSTANHPTS